MKTIFLNYAHIKSTFMGKCVFSRQILWSKRVLRNLNNGFLFNFQFCFIEFNACKYIIWLLYFHSHRRVCHAIRRGYMARCFLFACNGLLPWMLLSVLLRLTLVFCIDIAKVDWVCWNVSIWIFPMLTLKNFSCTHGGVND